MSWFRYEIGGRLEPIEPPFTWEEGEVDTEAFGRAGYNVDNDIDDSGDAYLGLRVYAHEADLKWAISVGDSSRICYLAIEGWPAFLDAMSRYAPMVIMGQLQDAAEVARAVRLGEAVPGDKRR